MSNPVTTAPAQVLSRGSSGPAVEVLQNRLVELGYLSSRKDVDPKRVAVMAYSAGGYYAPRVAAFEKRYAACVAWGPHYDYHAAWEKRWAAMKKDGKSVATSHFQLPWVLGTKDMESAMAKLKKFTLAGVAETIECPTLVTWGEEDKLIGAYKLALAPERVRIVNADDVFAK